VAEGKKVRDAELVLSRIAERLVFAWQRVHHDREDRLPG
jgi:hypothetical protein